MSLPDYAVARLNRLTYVRFALDHQGHSATVLNTGPQEAAHSSANGLWVHAQIEPFIEVHQVDDLSGMVLRLMGAPFRGQVVYPIETATEPDTKCPRVNPVLFEDVCLATRLHLDRF